MVAPLLAAPLVVAGPAQAEAVVKMPVVKKSIKQGLKQKTGVTVRVKCPARVKWTKGKVFFCKVRAKDGRKARVQVTLGGSKIGRVKWKVVP
jgi:hypothetical protein